MNEATAKVILWLLQSPRSAMLAVESCREDNSFSHDSRHTTTSFKLGGFVFLDCLREIKQSTITFIIKDKKEVQTPKYS